MLAFSDHSIQSYLDQCVCASSNPAVFKAIALEMLFLANIGVEIFRMDAVAFIWKRMGTTCESLPEAHKLLRAFNSICRIAAPSVLFKVGGPF